MFAKSFKLSRIEIMNHVVEWSKDVKYIVMTLGYRLSFTKHTNFVESQQLAEREEQANTFLDINNICCTPLQHGKRQQRLTYKNYRISN